MRIADAIHNKIEPLTRANATQGLAASTTEGTEEANGMLCIICGTHTVRYFPFDQKPWISHCPACATESLQPLPDQSEIEAYYTNYETTQSDEGNLATLIDLNELYLRHALHRADVNVDTFINAKYLEVGFGNGSGLIAASRLGADVTGVDIDPGSVTNVAETAQRHCCDLNLVRGEVDELSGGPNLYRFVRASHIIEHTLDPRVFVQKIRHLQPEDGYLFIECPNNKALFWILQHAQRRRLGRENFYNSLKVTEHLWGFTRDSLRKLIESSGYEVISCVDYAVGDARFQPETTIWYPRWRDTIARMLRPGRLTSCMYSSVRTFDGISSSLISGGTCLALVARSRPDHKS